MAQTYKPGETVPRDGIVECTGYPGTRDRVKAGTTFAPRDPWGETTILEAVPGNTSIDRRRRRKSRST
jgi:hypothetical protein